MARIALSCATGMTLLRLLDSSLLHLPVGRALSASLGVLCFVASALVLKDRHDRRALKRIPPAPAQLGGKTSPSSQETSANAVDLHEDNAVRWSFVPTTGTMCANLPNAIDGENDAVRMKVVVMHRPTHDPARDRSGQYPYSWHLHGRKRLWEVRVQLRFKKVPTSKMFFGLEMIPGPQTQTMITKRIQGMILAGIRGAIGKDFYHTPGDDPAKMQGAECEPPAFAMPFWALDQFVVSEIGEEPELTGDLSKVGHRRTDGVKAYKEAMQDMLDNLSDQKYYTWCFWGVSQFVDCNKWEFKMPGVTLDANKLCGRPPLFVVAYDLKDGGADGGSAPRKHYNSQKNYIFKVAVWSDSKPPEPTLLQDLLGAGGPESDESQTPSSSSQGSGAAVGLCCVGPALRHVDRAVRRVFVQPFAAELDEKEPGRSRRGRKGHHPLPRWVQAMFGGCLGAPRGGSAR